MPTPVIPLDDAKRTIEVIEDLLKKGYRPPGRPGRGKGALAMAAPFLRLSENSLPGRLRGIKRVHNLEPDWSLYKLPELPATIDIPPASPPGSDVDMAQHGWAPDHDLTHEVPAGLTLKGTSIRYDGDGEVQQYWNKTRAEGRLPDDVVQLPDPKRITKVSTLYDQTGRVTQQWIAEKPEDELREKLWRDFATELAADLPRAEPMAAPTYGSADLLACYPVGDHHLGMLAWTKETDGDSYDVKISEDLLVGSVDYLMGATPPCEQALVAFLGDFMHYDSFEAVTPTSRNLLDADGRYPKMVRAAVRLMRYAIAAALARHKKVHVIVEVGNHDLSSSIFLMECLANVYENEPRVTIDTSPSHYHYFEFGDCLIGTHHGHGSKIEKLPMIMAADRADAWGRTKYRYWWTGHVHNRQAQDFAGCSVESFRILAPVDAWAAQKGYRPIRDMKALVMHRQFGEVARHVVNPAMLQRSVA